MPCRLGIGECLWDGSHDNSRAKYRDGSIFPADKESTLENEVLIHDQFYSDDDAFLGYFLQREGVGSDKTSSQKHRFKSRFIDRR